MRRSVTWIAATLLALPAVAAAQDAPPNLDARSTGQSDEVVEVQGQAPRTGGPAPAGAPPAPEDEAQARWEEQHAREERERLRELQGEDDRRQRHHHRRRHHDHDDDDESDPRAIDFFWGGPEIGLAFVNLKMIEYDDLLPQEVDVKDNGFGFGATAGIKIKILSAGVHLAVGEFDDFDVWILDLDGQIRIPLGPAEPYIRLALGYAFLGSFEGPIDMGGVDVDGWNLAGGFGLDIYPSPYFSIGGGADFVLLNLTRSGGLTEVDLTQDGGGVGLGVWLQARAAIHF